MRPGDIIDERFAVEALAGSGGVGQVYRARDLLRGGRVAVKVLRPCAAQDIERFAREARVLARLSHPAIVSYIAHGTTADGPYLVMEWLDGEDLSARLARAPLSVVESVDLVRRAADALASAHEHGVVHRDIKPSNLFLRNRRLDDLKLLDFGLAWHEGAGPDLTRTGLVVGTLGYMAPEQAQGERAIDARSDVFALGCVMHRCIARRAPFESDRIGAVLMKILHEEAPLLSELAPGVPAALDDLVARMLAKDPAARPANAGVVAEALAAVLPQVCSAAAPAPVFQAPPPEEPKLACFVAIGVQRDWVPPTEPGLFVVFDVSKELTERVRAIARSFRGDVETLTDGSLLVTLSGGPGGSSTAESESDLASRAARCALAVRELLPATPIAAAMGRHEPSSGRLIRGSGSDTAAELLGATAAHTTKEPEGTPQPVRIDAMCAGLLDAAFEIRVDEIGMVLVGERRAKARKGRVTAGFS